MKNAAIVIVLGYMEVACRLPASSAYEARKSKPHRMFFRSTVRTKATSVFLGSVGFLLVRPLDIKDHGERIRKFLYARTSQQINTQQALPREILMKYSYAKPGTRFKAKLSALEMPVSTP